jgi:hypothetical protein
MVGSGIDGGIVSQKVLLSGLATLSDRVFSGFQ